VRPWWCFLAATLACAGLRPARDAAPGGIAGTVVDALTGEPIRFALVGHRDEDGIFRGALSESSGEFVLDWLAPGAHDFTVEHAGYQTASARGVAVESGRDTTVKVRLNPDDRTDIEGVAIEPPVFLEGPLPTYSMEALSARVEGLMVVRCTLTTQGAVTRCTVIRGLPHMGHVGQVLEQRRYYPAMRNGELIEVNFTFKIKLALPSEPEPDPAVN
jgi:hypothetical protein